MKLGIFVGAQREGLDFDTLIGTAQRAETDGFDSFWVPHMPSTGFNALTAMALVGRETQRIEVGTAVVPTYFQEPITLAQHAMTAQVAAKGRLALGIGLSHRPVIENMMGLSYEKPAKHMSEYLAVLNPLLRDGRVEHSGELYNVNAGLSVQGATPFPVLLAALAPRMLQLAGTHADGTITWMAGSKTIANHIAPRINEAADAAGKSKPRICVGLPVAVTDDVAAGREQAMETFQLYGQLTNYRRMLDIEDVQGPADVAVIGNENEVEAQLRAFAAAGATDFLASIFAVGDDRDASQARTWQLLQRLSGSL